MIIRKAIVSNFNDALRLVKNTGSSSVVNELLAKKGVFNAIVIEKIDNRAANILKQETISVGASVALNENVSRFKKGISNTVLFATVNQIEKLTKKLRLQPFRLKEIALKLENIVNKKKVFKYRERYMDLSNPVVMGIVNVDPNSFSGDGLTDPNEALKQAVEFERFGAGIIDIGAESSRPGTKLIDAKTEIKRLIPALKRIRKNVKIPVSVDTYKYETVKAALDEGADIINDIFALRKGRERSAKLIAAAKAGVILMHMKGIPKNMQTSPEYKNCTSEVYGFLAQQKEYAVGFDIEEERIAVDPGPGFGKTVEHSVELIKNIGVFSTLGAVVGAVSRKRFIKALAGEDRTSFIAANFLAGFCGADIIRAHDVKETVNVLKMAETFRRM
ncbi:dihydropteroate synthase [Endomicrobiia bacterium]|nr:dihydropteroate synthase [Endomicrobiia bacterium]GHT12722.1 dihydropteroate synthase [Endomicrobiia bacterium]GHT20127.1 dihydropteroate synthase [Endomicrobiia bacterium]GHT27745.1 dihydropteroate synthase [Endomicrobiia bacterium]GHT30353.1 dihydropteroate synthase [Endomicrobiia bacterium]